LQANTQLLQPCRTTSLRQLTCVETPHIADSILILQVAEQLRRFEREVRLLHLPLTPDTLRTLAHLDAALAAPGGALLLVGAAGAGRRTMVALIAHAHQLAVFTPAHPIGAGPRQLRAWLKDALRSAGVAGAPSLLLLEDHDVAACPEALDAVASLLASGEVPGLFTPEEMEKELKGLEAEEGAGGSVFNTFVARVKRVCCSSINFQRFAYALCVCCARCPCQGGLQAVMPVDSHSTRASLHPPHCAHST
jgi:P-loop containing dynein motor region D4